MLNQRVHKLKRMFPTLRQYMSGPLPPIKDTFRPVGPYHGVVPTLVPAQTDGIVMDFFCSAGEFVEQSQEVVRNHLKKNWITSDCKSHGNYYAGIDQVSKSTNSFLHNNNLL